MKFLLKEDIILINRIMIYRHGGTYIPPFNLLNEHALDYLVEAVHSEVFGRELYPDIHDKASLYLYNIIRNHIFRDGNAGTALETALLFLKTNGYRLTLSLTPIEHEHQKPLNISSEETVTLYNLVHKIYIKEWDLPLVQRWIKDNIFFQKGNK